MPLYDLAVRLEPARFIDIDLFEMARIPDDVDLAGIHIRRFKAGTIPEIESEVYLAQLQVFADDERQAKRRAVGRVQQILAVMGAFNVPLRIDYPGVIINAMRTDVSAPPPGDPPDQTGGFFEDPYDTPASIGWFRADVEFERRALSWRDRWPNWLQVALELNHLALISPVKPAFVISYSVLEILETNVVGKPEVILSDRLTKGDRKQLRRDLDEVLIKYKFDEDMRARLLQRLADTQKSSRAERFAALLQRVGMPADLDKDIQPIIHVRNKIAHPSEQPTLKEIVSSGEKLRRWVSRGLQVCLEPPAEKGAT